MVPSQCSFVVDVRITEMYTHEEIYETICRHVSCDVTPRSMRLRSTGIADEHPLVLAGLAMGKKCYGSPTSSDKALMPFPALKCGPGDSGRSHTADEFIFLHEVKEGIQGYIQMLEKVIR
ncbi:MAG: acetylornithine deacetylase, partial [Ferruginibacter sp.]|nr:acetylornithine deacetylase [Ferruginibacter sp.]